jgi:hypothetical protein
MNPWTEALLGRAKPVTAAAMAAALVVFAPSAFAQDGETAAIVPEIAADTEVETPWFEAFTLSMDDGPFQTELDSNTTTFELQSVGGRWGVTLGVEDNPDDDFEIEDVSAAAFYNLGERFRLSGELRWTAPEEELFLTTAPDEREPEIKFESALRF